MYSSSISAIQGYNVSTTKGEYKTVRKNDYVIINDRAYDPITGLPVDGVDAAPANIQPAVAPENSRPMVARGQQSHRAIQKSITLSRRYVRKPVTISPLKAEAEAKAPQFSPMTRQQLFTKKTEEVKKFTPASPRPIVTRKDRPAETHPVAHRATGRTLDIMAPRRQRAHSQAQLDNRARLATPQTASIQQQNKVEKQLKPATVLKNEAIHEAMAKEINSNKSKTRRTKQRKSNAFSRFMTIASASLAIILLAGYFTYLNMPNISIKMAAVQSGVNAKFPGYRPDGYALRGPITFTNGEVNMQFAYANTDRDFTIKQEKSNWNSTAVKEYVDTKSPDSTTTIVNGLTIYTYGSNAAWVNGGVLYTLEGNAPLSSDQIQRIATSM